WASEGPRARRDGPCGEVSSCSEGTARSVPHAVLGPPILVSRPASQARGTAGVPARPPSLVPPIVALHPGRARAWPRRRRWVPLEGSARRKRGRTRAWRTCWASARPRRAWCSAARASPGSAGTSSTGSAAQRPRARAWRSWWPSSGRWSSRSWRTWCAGSGRDGRTQQAALKKLLRCGVTSAPALLRALAEEERGRCNLNRRLEDTGQRELRPDTVQELAAELRVRVLQRMQVSTEGDRPVLVTAPHNIYVAADLHRDGHVPHVMEEYTTFIAQRLAKQLQGASITWSRAEQRRSELMWLLARRRGLDSATYIDARNRDPNYLTRSEVLDNPWFRHMRAIAEGFREGAPRAPRPALHVDVHGCRDPPSTPSHLTVGLAAMRWEAEAGRDALSAADVRVFAAALEEELTLALGGLSLGGRGEVPVRVLAPAWADAARAERLSGAWPPASRRATQSQQAVAYAGFTHSCQLELSKALRRVLVADEVALLRFGGAVYKAWALSAGVPLPARRRARRGRGRARGPWPPAEGASPRTRSRRGV
ncbi:unnamed protein product, partial [Prorocentrum cordatum]